MVGYGCHLWGVYMCVDTLINKSLPIHQWCSLFRVSSPICTLQPLALLLCWGSDGALVTICICDCRVQSVNEARIPATLWTDHSLISHYQCFVGYIKLYTMCGSKCSVAHTYINTCCSFLKEQVCLKAGDW